MKPEMIVRKLAHRMGYRFRLHRKELPGCPDLVFPAKKKIIFVHGCFWHQHSEKECKLSRKPKSNLDYWIPKLNKNVLRDIEKNKILKEIGWDVLVIWECYVDDEGKLKEMLIEFLG